MSTVITTALQTQSNYVFFFLRPGFVWSLLIQIHLDPEKIN